jgi:hypothetical protein
MYPSETQRPHRLDVEERQVRFELENELLFRKFGRAALASAGPDTFET